MNSVKVTAWLSTPLAASDNWTPSLDALLIWLLLDEQGLASSNPSLDAVQEHVPIVDKHMPIAKLYLDDDLSLWYWAVSSPRYLYDGEQSSTLYKRWDMQDQHLDWRGKRRNWSTSEGHTKSCSLPIRERNTSCIVWYAVGDRHEIQRLLNFCCSIGKKRRSQVHWQVDSIDRDLHLWSQSGDINRPVPHDWLVKHSPMCNRDIRQWAWRPPTFLPENSVLCAMPCSNIQKVNDIYGFGSYLAGQGRSHLR